MFHMIIERFMRGDVVTINYASNPGNDLFRIGGKINRHYTEELCGVV